MASIFSIEKRGVAGAARRRRQASTRSCNVTGDGAGAHVALWPKRRIDEALLIARAAEHRVGFYRMTRGDFERKGWLVQTRSGWICAQRLSTARTSP